MDIVFDPAKDAINLVKHGLSFTDFTRFDAEPEAVIDGRFDYGETRYRAVGRIGGVAHCIVFTQSGNQRRLISFRRAHEKELRRYE